MVLVLLAALLVLSGVTALILVRDDIGGMPKMLTRTTMAKTKAKIRRKQVRLPDLGVIEEIKRIVKRKWTIVVLAVLEKRTGTTTTILWTDPAVTTTMIRRVVVGEWKRTILVGAAVVPVTIEAAIVASFEREKEHPQVRRRRRRRW